MPLSAEQQAAWNVYDVHQYVEMANGLYRAGLRAPAVMAAALRERAVYGLLTAMPFDELVALARSVIEDQGRLSANPCNPFGPKAPT